jgi:hypothetical protein
MNLTNSYLYTLTVTKAVDKKDYNNGMYHGLSLGICDKDSILGVFNKNLDDTFKHIEEGSNEKIALISALVLNAGDKDVYKYIEIGCGALTISDIREQLITKLAVAVSELP